MKVGERYIFVDALGRPITTDLDLLIQSKPHQKIPGEHLKKGEARQKREAEGKKEVARNFPEDDFEAEEIWNLDLWRETGHMLSMINHGGRGASARHVAENEIAGKKGWSRGQVMLGAT